MTDDKEGNHTRLNLESRGRAARAAVMLARHRGLLPPEDETSLNVENMVREEMIVRVWSGSRDGQASSQRPIRVGWEFGNYFGHLTRLVGFELTFGNCPDFGVLRERLHCYFGGHVRQRGGICEMA
jgi:hypothetical protein